MLKRYDPSVPPNPEGWLKLSETKRLEMVRRQHLKAGPKLPGLDAHAALHVAVETQIAMGPKTPASRAAQRLMAEGLDRHETIHALGALVAELVYDLREGVEVGDVRARYFAQVEALSAHRWRPQVATAAP